MRETSDYGCLRRLNDGLADNHRIGRVFTPDVDTFPVQSQILIAWAYIHTW